MTVERLRASLAERYTLEKELGQGGMATVYLARDVKHDRQVALKVLRPELAAILGRERFLSEIRLTAKLDHPHILTLLDSGESEGFVWYTLPYIRGESLRDKIKREQQLPVAEAVSIARQVAGALEHAHQHGIIHRDVKPENILLHEGEAMLADFGIALAVKEAGGQRLTETGLSIGTPQYMSPEQATAERQLDARSDVYSLGAVLYEMLAGEPPFTGITSQAVIAKLMVERPTSLRTVRDTIPAGLEAVVAQALAKVPADRFPSAAAFAEALAAPEAHRVPWRVSKRMLIGVGAAAVVLLGAGLWLGPKLRSTRIPAARAEPTLTQVTFSGNAYGPALSPDGKQLAYGAETCPTPGTCTTALVVEDLARGERRVLPEPFSHIYRLTWSPDQRFLVMSGEGGDPPVTGTYLASLFSNEVRFLGGAYNGSQFLGGSDTIIARPSEANIMLDRNPRLTTRWFVLLSADGALLDSIPFNVAGLSPWPLPSPDGRRILIWSYTSDDSRTGQSNYLIDRKGDLTDSLPTLSGFHAHTGLQWTPTGDAVLVMVRADSVNRDIWTLLRFGASAEGTVRLPPDTLAARLRLPGQPDWRHGGGTIALSPPSQSGEHAIGLLTETGTLSTLERPALTAPPARKATLISGATGGLGAVISPDGKRVLVRREASLAGQPATQLEVWPFDGGSGTPLGPPRRGHLLAVWSMDGSSIYRLAERGSPGLLEHSRIDVATGRTLESRPVPDSLEWYIGPFVTRDSLLLYRSVGRGSIGTPQEWRTYPQGGGIPLVFSFPDTAPWVNASIVSPDGQGSWLAAVITSGGLRGGDTVYTLHLSRPGVPAKRVMQFHGPWSDLTFLHAGPGPTFEVVADMITGGWRRLLLEPGRPPRDLGVMPFPLLPWASSVSADGRRGVLAESETRTDIWLLKWPGGDSTGAGGRQ